jgi:hypothetical protein
VNANVTVEMSEYFQHFRRQDVHRFACLILCHGANTPGFFEKSALPAPFHEDKPILLMFEYGSMSDVKIRSKFFAKFVPGMRTRLDGLFDFEVSDDIQRWTAIEAPAFQARIENEKVAFS